jgi:hypothetical protein
MNLLTPQEARVNRNAGVAPLTRYACHGGRMLKK